MLQSRRFHRIAARVPFVRGRAHREARRLFDLCAGFVYAQVVLACVRLDLFSLLRDGPRTLSDIASATGLPEGEAKRLLDAAASLDLLTRRGTDLYRLGPLGAAFLGTPGLAEIVEHHALLYRDLTDPVALLRSGGPGPELGAYWTYAGLDGERMAPEDAERYSALMAASQPFLVDDVLAAYPIQRHRKLLDVGGGEGGFVLAAAERAPDLALSLFDLPEVAARAEAAFSRAGLSAVAHGGDFRTSALPVGADLATMIRVAFDHPDEMVLTILRRVRAALPEDGVLLLAEPMAETRGAEPVGAAYFGFYLLAMGGGRSRSAAELTALLQEAGFRSVTLARTRRPLLVSVLVAKP
ncbi:MAG: methyltransferase [Pseudomonadota bacterium]